MAASSPERLAVRVVHALAGQVCVVDLDLPRGATVGDAVGASGLLAQLPGVALQTLDLGVFNRRCGPERALQDGDRVEIYRPLLIDPKAARHLRVAARRTEAARARQAARPQRRAAQAGEDEER
jgi:putative ubiquitin-RnfH superfamily antitoxin RatB of RatAB toxin-antitoxin module